MSEDGGSSFSLETSRLKLRLFARRDVGDLFRMYSDPHVMRFMPRAAEGATPERAATHVSLFREQFEQTGFTFWAVERKEDGKFAGRIGLWPLDGTDEVELGYLVAPEFWGQGIATEASKACLEYGMGELGLDQIAAIANPANTASLRVMEKLGFTFVRKARFYEADVLYHRIEQPGS